MLNLINQERRAAGLPDLQLEQRLNSAAEDHSQWMLTQDVFSHTGAGGSSATDRMTAADFDFSGSWRSGENIGMQSSRGAVGYSDDVEDIHDRLMDSPGHRANILNTNYDYVGIGIEIGDYNGYPMVMITQNFAATDGQVLLDNGGTSPTPPAPPSPEIISGTNGGDLILGSDANEELRGLDGNDVLVAKAGSDTLLGGNGNDKLRGGQGADRLDGGQGRQGRVAMSISQSKVSPGRGMMTTCAVTAHQTGSTAGPGMTGYRADRETMYWLAAPVTILLKGKRVQTGWSAMKAAIHSSLHRA